MDDVEFEKDLVCSIAEFIRSEGRGLSFEAIEDIDESERLTVIGTTSTHIDGIKMCEDNGELTHVDTEMIEIRSPEVPRKRVRFVVPESPQMDLSVREELQELTEAREAGMAFILGHCYVRAKRGSSLIKKLVINIGYDFLRRNCRAPTYALSFPRASTLEVGMIYHV